MKGENMEDIQVNEYVRTKNNGIKRIDAIFENKTVNKYGYEIGSDWDGKEYGIIKTTDIVRHSKDIIDLIELYDYVNGFLVFEIITYEYGTRKIKLANGTLLQNKDIKNILTHEQYEANCYEVKERK